MYGLAKNWISLLLLTYLFSFHQFWPIAYKIAEASRKTLILHIILNVTNVVHLIILILFVLEIQSLEFIFKSSLLNGLLRV